MTNKQEPLTAARRPAIALPLAVLPLAALAAAALSGCTAGIPPSIDPECLLDGSDAETERSPGYPYDIAVWNDQIAPLLAADCIAAGCHADTEPPAGRSGGLTVFASGTACDRVKTFKQVRAKVDLVTPGESRILYALEGGALTGEVAHPLDYGATDAGQEKLDLLRDFIEAATATCAADGGCSTDLRDYFDREVFEEVIAPGLTAAGDGAGCSGSAACHAPPVGQLGFVLPVSPAPGSDEMEAAYQAVVSRIDLDAEPGASLFYRRATVPHAGGVSTTVEPDAARAILDWIEDAIAARSPDGNDGCADPARLDVGVFRDDILPILRGEVDLNGGGGIATGCTRETCHGERRPGALILDPDDSPEDQLASFACFVSLTSPSSSQVLVCPRKDPRCAIHPHPGDRIFGDSADDQNYQRLMSFLFSAITDSTPIDLAFYARRINPMFDNRNAVQDGAQGRTCSDTSECHGVAAASQVPPNGANLAIIPDAGDDLDRLRVNFTEASAFLNFLSPDQSSLFLYPTDEIFDETNPAGTGIHHPGGADFAVDSRFALDILTFARGLRPDGEGFQNNWLVAGDFQGAADVDEETAIDEEAAAPQIFDDSSGGELAGRWDALFSDQQEVDVGAFLTGNPGSGRIAYAVAYVFNTTTNPREVDVEIESINSARLRLGDGTIADIAPGGSTRARILVPPTRASDQPTGSRILIKLFESPDDGGMRFSVRLLRPGGDDPYDDDGGELIIKLAPRGGI
ncbi:MAG TPA: hypothetical protein VK698_17850 [Kofleriaceae bacterium]|nr:hypothetical protein [Kofleriaceae bacterium]